MNPLLLTSLYIVVLVFFQPNSNLRETNDISAIHVKYYSSDQNDVRMSSFQPQKEQFGLFYPSEGSLYGFRIIIMHRDSKPIFSSQRYGLSSTEGSRLEENQIPKEGTSTL